MRSLVGIMQGFQPDWSVELDDEDVVTDVLVIVRTVRMDAPGKAALGIWPGDNSDYVTQAGMAFVASRMITNHVDRQGDDD